MGVMEGEVVLVTGGGRGFGRAMAERFAAEGAKVAIAARSRGQLDEVVQGIAKRGGTAIAVTADITDAAQVERAVRETEEALGPITRLVSNAGVPGPFGPVWVTDPDEWWRSETLHLRAPYLLLRHVLPGMVERGAGRVICTSALASRMTLPMLSAYSVGKAALNKLVEMTAAELSGTGVSIFALEPGFAVTQMAEDTYASPDARQWLPHMMDMLDARRDEPDADLEGCAQRAVDLFSGKYDPLSGLYLEKDDPIEQWLAEATAK